MHFQQRLCYFWQSKYIGENTKRRISLNEQTVAEITLRKEGGKTAQKKQILSLNQKGLINIASVDSVRFHLLLGTEIGSCQFVPLHVRCVPIRHAFRNSQRSQRFISYPTFKSKGILLGARQLLLARDPLLSL